MKYLLHSLMTFLCCSITLLYIYKSLYNYSSNYSEESWPHILKSCSLFMAKYYKHFVFAATYLISISICNTKPNREKQFYAGLIDACTHFFFHPVPGKHQCGSKLHAHSVQQRVSVQNLQTEAKCPLMTSYVVSFSDFIMLLQDIVNLFPQFCWSFLDNWMLLQVVFAFVHCLIVAIRKTNKKEYMVA